MTKESTIELQKFDCNCNDCKFLVRRLDKQNDVLSNDKITQEEMFYFVKEKKTAQIEADINSLKKHRDIIKGADRKIAKKENQLKLHGEQKWGYQGQKTPIQYGHCEKLSKAITFIANTLQLETQYCFEHRRS